MPPSTEHLAAPIARRRPAATFPVWFARPPPARAHHRGPRGAHGWWAAGLLSWELCRRRRPSSRLSSLRDPARIRARGPGEPAPSGAAAATARLRSDRLPPGFGATAGSTSLPSCCCCCRQQHTRYCCCCCCQQHTRYCCCCCQHQRRRAQDGEGRDQGDRRREVGERSLPKRAGSSRPRPSGEGVRRRRLRSSPSSWSCKRSRRQ